MVRIARVFLSKDKSNQVPQSSSRSSSRNKKRSTTNLADLRLAPLSTRFVPDESRQHHGTRSPYEEAADTTFARHHPTYMQGRSAPTTPGILSRSSSRRHLGGGLSRRGSLYDDGIAAADVSIVYPVGMMEESRQTREGSGITKAKSEATLALGHQRLSNPAVRLNQTRCAAPRRKTAGSNTPRIRSNMRLSAKGEEDWLSHATATANALLQESRGQTWLSSRDSPSAMALPSSDEDDVDDEGYEEMAATAQLSLPQNPRTASPSAYRWGSRFGSRSGSRRASRIGSPTLSRTPLHHPNLEGVSSYFEAAEDSDDDANAGAVDEVDDEAELKQLVQNPSIGFGGIFERIAGIGWFAGGDSEESGVETDLDGDEGKRRTPKPLPPPPVPGDDGQRVGMWEDAAWLLSIAGRALT